MLTIVLFLLGLFIGLSFIWIPFFFKKEKDISEDKIEEVIENKLDSFMSEYKKTIKKFICKKIDEHNGNDSSSVNEEDVQNICMDMLESYTNDTINPVLEELATADDLNAVVKGIDALVNTCNTITLKVNEFDNEIYGDDEYYGLVDRIESVESTIDEANNSK